MADLTTNLLETIVRYCAESAPNPWYPSAFAQATGVPREDLDPQVDRLRMGGFLQLTDWVKGYGQGCRLTPAGNDLLQKPKLLALLRQGQLPELKDVAPAEPRDRAALREARFDRVREICDNPVWPVLTFTFIVINVLIFFLPDQRIKEWAAATGPLLVKGEWWRLLSTCFIHGNELHLGCNMFALYMFGKNEERIWGHTRFLAICIISGITGSCAGFLGNPRMTLVGFSGIICGLFAADIAWTFLNRRFLAEQFLAVWKRNLVINIVMLVFVSNLPGVSGAGHLGGAVGGLVTAVLFDIQRFAPGWKRWFAMAGILLVPVLGVAVLVRAMNTDRDWRSVIWALDFYPNLVKLSRSSVNLYNDKVEPVLKLPPKERSPAQIEEALKALAVAQEQVATALALLTKSGKYQNEEAEDEQQQLRKHFEKNRGLFQQIERRLREEQKPKEGGE